MRHKDYLLDRTDIKDTYEDKVLSSQRGIFARDTWDTRRCDATFVNFLGAETVSIGTVMEISWAWAFHRPVVLVMEKEGNIHEHEMVREACPFRVETIEEGIDVLGALFNQNGPQTRFRFCCPDQLGPVSSQGRRNRGAWQGAADGPRNPTRDPLHLDTEHGLLSFFLLPLQN